MALETWGCRKFTVPNGLLTEASLGECQWHDSMMPLRGILRGRAIWPPVDLPRRTAGGGHPGPRPRPRFVRGRSGRDSAASHGTAVPVTVTVPLAVVHKVTRMTHDDDYDLSNSG